jgi:Holliday junction DNA helicase RuvA
LTGKSCITRWRTKTAHSWYTHSGIGRKTAERLLLELRDKLASIAEGRVAGPDGSAGGDALNALVTLGYSVKEAKAALARLDPSLAAPDAIRQALKLLSKVS